MPDLEELQEFENKLLCMAEVFGRVNYRFKFLYLSTTALSTEYLRAEGRLANFAKTKIELNENIIYRSINDNIGLYESRQLVSVHSIGFTRMTKMARLM